MGNNQSWANLSPDATKSADPQPQSGEGESTFDEIFKATGQWVMQPFKDEDDVKPPSAPIKTKLSQAHIDYLYMEMKRACIINGLIAAVVALSVGSESGGVLICLRIPPFTDFIGNEECAWWDATQEMLFALLIMSAVMVRIAKCLADRDVPFHLEPFPPAILSAYTLPEPKYCSSKLLLWLCVCVVFWLISLGFFFIIFGVSRASPAGPLPLFVFFKTLHCAGWAVPISFLANWTALCRASDDAQKRLRNEKRRRKELLEAGEAPAMGFQRDML
jgi:hypothetical protein